MYGFNGFNIDGQECFVDEMGNDIGYVHLGGRVIQAIRLSSSVYMGTDGKVYAANRQKCQTYTTDEWYNWARRKMLSIGFQPRF